MRGTLHPPAVAIPGEWTVRRDHGVHQPRQRPAGRRRFRRGGCTLPGPARSRGQEEHDFGSSVILPGFVDAHTHITIRPGEGDQHGQLRMPSAWQAIRGVRNLADMLSSGVTTARIMSEAHGIDFEFRDAVARGEVAGPRLLVSGFGLSPPGGHGSGEWGVTGPAALRTAVQERVARRADHIKVFMTGGVWCRAPALHHRV